METDSYSFFKQTVDELVELAKYDEALAEGIKYVDKMAMKNGITFYNQVFQILYKHDIDQKAKDWLNTRN